jgi:acyl carrier protein
MRKSVSKNQLTETIIQLISKVLELDASTLNLNSSMDSLYQWDSMNNLKILVKVEEYLDDTIELDDLVDVRTINDWVRVAEKYCQII